jgi:hypothetical protein
MKIKKEKKTSLLDISGTELFASRMNFQMDWNE